MASGIRKAAAIAALIIFMAGTAMIPVPALAGMGVIDFRPYWSSSYLLRQGQDFSDSSNMDRIERTLTGWRETYTMHAWFSPTGNLALLPYTYFPFERAAHFWLVTNIYVILISAALLWFKTKKQIWVPIFAVLIFSPTLLSIKYGQVNTLVLAGLALFIYFDKTGGNFLAGASLILTTIKPHLVILTLPLLILNGIHRRNWRMLAGFTTALISCAAILFLLYPSWLVSFWNLVFSGMSNFRETPTFAGIFAASGDRQFGKWIWVAGLMAASIAWWMQKNRLDQQTMIDISLMAGLLLSPIGWSYDQIILIIPIIRILKWVVRGSLNKKTAAMLVMVLAAANGVLFYERTLLLSDAWFAWTPALTLAIYLTALGKSDGSFV
jgi:hypothetical protein